MAEIRNTGRMTYTGLMSTAAAVGALLLWSRTAKASPTGDIVIPPEIAEVLAAMAADISDIDVNLLPQILEALRNHPSGGQGYAPNLDYPYTGRYTLAAALTAQRLPFVPISDDFSIVLKGWNGNGANTYIWVARSAADAVNQNAAWPLAAGESIAYRVRNAEEIYVSASVANIAVYWTVEQRRS